MTQEIKRADVWTLSDRQDVLVVPLSGLDKAYEPSSDSCCTPRAALRQRDVRRHPRPDPLLMATDVYEFWVLAQLL